MQVAKWGNSQSVRIPEDVVRTLDLKEDDDIDLVRIVQGTLAIITDRQRREAAPKTLRSFRESLPADFEFDREEANAR